MAAVYTHASKQLEAIKTRECTSPPNQQANTNEAHVVFMAAWAPHGTRVRWDSVDWCCPYTVKDPPEAFIHLLVSSIPASCVLVEGVRF